MADTGWQFVGTGADDASYGNHTWSNPGNITADDNSKAAVSVSTTTHYLKGTNIGLSIPTGDVIDGIEVRFEANTDDGNSDVDRVRLVDETGAIGTTDRSASEVIPGTDTVLTFGGASDLWGDSWGETDVENSNFGFVMAAKNGGSTDTVTLDYFQVKVYHSPAAAGLVEREFPRGLNRGLARGVA